MVILHVLLAVPFAFGFWYFGSWAIAQMVFRTETRNQQMAESQAWRVFVAFTVFLVFLLSFVILFGLTYAMQKLSL